MTIKNRPRPTGKIIFLFLAIFLPVIVHAELSVSSVQCFQRNAHLTPAQGFQQVMGLNIVTTGSGSGSLTSISFDLSGVSDLSDILDATLYSTQGKNHFYSSVTTPVLGGAMLVNSQEITFTGTVNLQPGNNYFWLSFKIAAEANFTNEVDVDCTEVIAVGVNQAITNPAPAGSLRIESSHPKIAVYALARDLANISDADLDETFDSVTDVYLIGLISHDDNGDLTYTREDWQGILTRIKTIRGNRDVRFLLGLGNFENISDSDVKRASIVSNVVQFLIDNDLDGVDIDWEYPKNAAQWTFFDDVCRDFQLAMFPIKGWLCSAASQWNPHTSEVLSHLDYLNLMSYDNGGYHSTYDKMVSDVNFFQNSRYVPRHRILPGLPSYTNEIHDRTWNAQRGYNAIIAAYPNIPPYVDGITEDFGYTSTDTLYDHGFNGITTFQKKSEYIVNTGCGGAMLFRLATDMPISHRQSLLRSTLQVINDDTLEYSKLPLNGSWNVPRQAAIKLSFPEPVTPQALKFITIYRADHSVFERVSITDSALVSISGADVTISTTDQLAASGIYYVILDSGAFMDSRGRRSKSVYGYQTWTFQTGPKPQTALKFNGVNDYVNLGTSLPHLGGQTHYTIEAWIKIDGGQSGSIIARSNRAIAGEFALNITADNKISFSRDVAPWGVTSTSAITPGEWTHVAPSYDGTFMRVFMNGLEDASLEAAGSSGTNNGNVLIAASEDNGNPTNFFKGSIDQLRIWSIARTSTELVNDQSIRLNPQTPNLISVWDFNAGGGRQLADRLGNYSGNLQNSPTWVDGVILSAVPPEPIPQNALQFDGIDDFIDLGTSLPHVGGSYHYTIEAWVNLDGGKSGSIFARFNGGVAGEYALLINADNTVKFSREAAPWGLNSTSALDPNTWTHVAVTYDGAKMRIFLNGVEDATLDATGNSGVNNGNVIIGARYNNGTLYDFYKGSLDHIRFWNTARSATEIQSAMQRTLEINTSGLQAVWNFDQSSGSHLEETSGAYHGTINGMDNSAWVSGVTVARVHTGYAQHMQECYPNLPNQGPEMDSDNDGVVNFLEYSLGMLMDQSDPSELPKIQADPNTDTTIVYSFFRARNGVRYILESSPSMDWSHPENVWDSATEPTNLAPVGYTQRINLNPSFLLKAAAPYEMGIPFQKALQSRFHFSLVFMDGHMLRQSIPRFS